MLKGDSSKESEDIRREGKFTHIGSNVWTVKIKFSQILYVMIVDSRHRCQKCGILAGTVNIFFVFFSSFEWTNEY